MSEGPFSRITFLFVKTSPCDSICQCEEECGRRRNCIRLNYRRHRKSCLLYSSDTVETGSEETSCIIIKKNQLESFEPDCDCDDDSKVCQLDGTCKHKECPAVHEDRERGRIYGNVLDISSKVKVTCNVGFIRTPDRNTGTCNDTGQWGDFPKCLKECGGPCTTYAYSYVTVGGGTMEGQKRTYTCDPGFYSSRNTSELTVYVQCITGRKSTGELTVWYNAPNAYCTSGDVYPKNPQNIWYAGCEMYEINDDTFTKAEARYRCQPYGDLAKVNSELDMYYLKSKLTGKVGSYWIQGQGSSAGWTYEDGSTITYIGTTWAISSLGACLILDGSIGHQRNNAQCDTLNGYICEYTHRRSYHVTP